MKYVLLALLLTCFFQMKPSKNGEFNNEYISREQTMAINGVFVVIVFLRHYSSFVKIDPDSTFGVFNTTINQQLVVPFLFYSGYGIMTSIMRKGKTYVHRLPLRRAFVLWMHFAIAVALFVAYNQYSNTHYDNMTVFKAFFGWISIGNSCWYIFCMLMLYVFTFISFMLFSKNPGRALVAMFALVHFYIWFMRIYKPDENYWYTTVLMYPVGMTFAYFKPEIDKALMKDNQRYYLVLAFTLVTLKIVWSLLPLTHYGFGMYQLKNLLFMAAIVLLTMKVRIVNPILSFFGKYTFEIFILQRLPLRYVSSQSKNMYVILIASFIATVIMAVVYKFLMDILDKLWNLLLDKLSPKKKPEASS